MISKKFVQKDDKIFIYSFDEVLAKDKLTPGVYTVSYSQLYGFFLQKNKDRFEPTKKSYGSLDSRAEKIINTYEARNASTGVLLTGLKGSGKTLLSQKVSNKMIDKGYPIILVEDSYGGEAFVNFLNGIGECVLVFDEFAKVFSRDAQTEKDDQDGLLGIFDGNKSIKRLIFVIDNNVYQINEFYKNRPGRLFYHFEYSKLEESVIDEYCIDFGIHEQSIAKIKSAYYKIRGFSFDILKAVVDEHLRYPKEEIADIISSLNVDTDSSYQTVLTVKRIVKKANKTEYQLHKSNSPFEFNYGEHFNFNIAIHEKGKPISENMDKALDKDQCFYIAFGNRNIAFENKDKVVFDSDAYLIECEKSTKMKYDYNAF